MSDDPIRARGKVIEWLAGKGIRNIRFEGDGRCVVRDDKGKEFLLWLPVDSTVLYVYFHIMEVNEALDVVVFAMSLNLDPDNGGDLVLGYDPNGQQIMACLPLDFSSLPSSLLDNKIQRALERSVLVKEQIDAFRFGARDTLLGDEKPYASYAFSVSQRFDLKSEG